MKKVRVFLFSGYAGQYIEPLKERGIYVDRSLDGVSPLAVVGDKEESMQKYLNACKDVSSIVSIRKNFGQMISRESKIYESNYIEQPIGKYVAESNTTDYFILCSSAFYASLYQIGDSIYSDVWPKNKFSEALKNRNALPFPLPKTFSWKHQIDLFTKECLKNYDSDHIILIRSNLLEWTFNGKSIFLKKESNRYMRSYIREVEDYFIECTNCHCIEENLSHFPQNDDFLMPSYVNEMITERISEIVNGKKSEIQQFCLYKNPLIKKILLSLNLKKINDIKNAIDEYDKKISALVEKQFFHNDSNKVYSDLNKLSLFIRSYKIYSLSDYYREASKRRIDINLVELYTAYFKLDMDDIITIWAMYQSVSDKSLFKNVINNICCNIDCFPFRYINDKVKRNCLYLKKYSYLDNQLKSFLTNIEPIFVARLNENMFIQFLPNSQDAIRIIYWKNKPTNLKELFNNGLKCNAHEIDGLSKSWKFYIQRAKKGFGNIPLCLSFENEKEFLESVVFLDYPTILESENALIALEGNLSGWVNKNIEGYKTRCSLEVLVNPNTKIFHIGCGLGDQIRHYLHAKKIENLSNAPVIYEDLDSIKNPDGLSYMSLDKIVTEGKDEFLKKCLSNIISPQLYRSYNFKKSIVDYLIENGLENMSCVVAPHNINAASDDVTKLVVYGDQEMGVHIAANGFFKYYAYLNQPEYFLSKNEWIGKYISFPEYDNEKNKLIADKMMSCDAVALHIRCGDMVVANPNRAPLPDFYYRCLENVLKIQSYKNIKVFVFSDDMNWVKEHGKELGLDLIDSDNVYFIKHNKMENSYWDMKLISLGKVIIASTSGFAHVAGLLSKRKEILVFQSGWINEALHHFGWENRWEIHQRCCIGYHYLGCNPIETYNWEIKDILHDLVLKKSNGNYNFYRYNITEGNGTYSIKLSGISADYAKFTAGLFDFKEGRIVRYDYYKTSEDCWFNFSVGDVVDGLAFCFYAGVHRRTAGNSIEVEEFTVRFKKS